MLWTPNGLNGLSEQAKIMHFKIPFNLICYYQYCAPIDGESNNNYCFFKQTNHGAYSNPGTLPGGPEQGFRHCFCTASQMLLTGVRLCLRCRLLELLISRNVLELQSLKESYFSWDNKSCVPSTTAPSEQSLSKTYQRVSKRVSAEIICVKSFKLPQPKFLG